MIRSTRLAPGIATGPRIAPGTAIAIIAVALLGGCEDPTARSSADAHQTIAEASVDFRKATVATTTAEDEDFDAVQRDLNAVITRLNGVTDAEPGQLAAASMLSAEALTELAQMSISAAQKIEQQHRAERQAVRSSVIAAGRLDAMAAARESVTTRAERESLLQAREAAEQSLAQLTERMATLDGPIADRTSRNTQDAAEAERLRAEANNLLYRARELGHANGFLSFQQAVSTRRDADEIDYEIALREIELDFELQPEHNLAGMQVEQFRLTIESIRRTLAEFDELEAQYAADVQATRQRIDDLRRTINESLSRLNAGAEGALSDAYEQARTHLERAASSARTATTRLRGDQANPARLVLARVLEQQGRLAWTEARGLADHLGLLRAITDAGANLDSGSIQRQLAELGRTHSELIEQAKTYFTQAEESLNQVTGRAAEGVREVQLRLQDAASALTGESSAGEQP